MLSAAVIAVIFGVSGLTGVAAATPQYPATWTISNNVATGTKPDGTVVTATVTGPAILIAPSGSLVFTGSTPVYFPSTTNQALHLLISGCGGPSCGSITYSFSQPVASPVLYVGDVGSGAINNGLFTAYHDSPITLGSGTFSLYASGSQTANMSVQNSGTTVGITAPAAEIGMSGSNASSCGTFGCGVYSVNTAAPAVTSVTMNFGYAGTGTSGDVFSMILGTLPASFPQQWDAGKTNNGGGGSGTWNATNVNWTYTGTSTDAAWNTGNDAIFAGTSGVVKIASGFTAQASSLSFKTNNYVLTAGTGSGTLELTGAAQIDVLTGLHATISAPIIGSSGLTKTGAGTLLLTGTNTYSGATTINGGTLRGGAANTFSAGSATTINTGGKLNLGGYAQTINTVTLAGGTLLNGSLTGAVISTGGTVGNLGGSASLTTTSGTTTLFGTNTYSGATTLNGGTLRGNAANTFSAGSATTINTGGTVNLGGYAQTINTVTLAGGTLVNGSLTGAVTSTGGTVSGLGGSASLKTTSGTTTLFGTNTYSGATTINGGTLRGNAANTFSAGSVTTINAGGTVNLGGYNQTVSSLSGAGKLTNNNVSSDAILTNQGASSTFSGVIQDGPTHKTGLTQDSGGNTLTLSGINSFSGGLTVAAGTVSIGAAANVGTGTVTLNGGTLLTTQGLTLNQAITLGANGGTFDNGGNADTLNGDTTDNGTVGMTFIGSGTTTLSGTDHFSSVYNHANLVNNGTGYDDLYNYNTFTNNHTYTANIAANTGTITNAAGATWNGDVKSGANTAGGSIVNQGIWNGLTSYNNGGSLDNQGTWYGDIDNVAGAFTNTGTLNGSLTNGTGALANVTGSVTGNLSNAGTLSTNGSYGVVSISGDFSQTQAGTLIVKTSPNATPGVGYDQVSVGGAATLDGTLALQVANGPYAVGTQYDLVHANSLSGGFSNVTYSQPYTPAAYIVPQVSYTGTDAYLTLAPSQLAFTSGRAVGLNQFILHQSLLNNLDGLLAAQGGNSGDILRVNQRPDPAAWTRVLRGTGSAYGARDSYRDLLVGAGSEVRPGLVLGGAITATRANSETDLQQVKTRTLGVAGYGRYNQGPLVASASLGFGRLTSRSVRTLLPTPQVATGSANGWYGGAAGQAGWRFGFTLPKGTGFILPNLSAAYLHTNRDAYTESGAGSLDLHYATARTDLGSIQAGVRAGLDQQTSATLTVSPWLGLGVVRYFGNLDQNQNLSIGTFEQGLPGPLAPKLAAQVSGGIAWTGTDWRLQFGYRGQFSHHTYLNALNLDASYRW